MLRILERSTKRLVFQKSHQIWLLTIISGVISGCLLLFGTVSGFSQVLSFLIGIFAVICGICILFPAATMYVLDKRSGELIVTNQCLLFRHTYRYRLREIASINIGLLSSSLAQQYKSFSDQHFLYFSFISGQLLLVTTLELAKPDELQFYEQVTEQIQAFLDIP